MKEFFKVPEEEQRRIAIGSLPGLPYRTKKALQQVIPLFPPIKKPEQGEWLWEHEEEGQTFAAYQGQMHNVVNEKRNVIYIKPLQKDIDKKFLSTLAEYCQCFFYPLKIKISQHTQVIKNVPTRINQYTQKLQANAKSILGVLQKSLKADAFCLIGVTTTDLYPRDEWNFVFGLASIRERTGVFSFARYDFNFFKKQNYQINYETILWRSIGVMVHEITHMFGVRHCIFFECLMNGSNHQEQSSRKPLQLCPVCLRKLQSNIKFDILERFQNIQKFINLKFNEDKRIIKHKLYIDTVIDKIQNSIKTK